MLVRFYWDFFGPRAQGTARHFEKHLGAFLSEQGLLVPLGTEQGGEGHWYAFCDPPDVPAVLTGSHSQAPGCDGAVRENVSERIARVLKPKRVLER